MLIRVDELQIGRQYEFDDGTVVTVEDKRIVDGRAIVTVGTADMTANMCAVYAIDGLRRRGEETVGDYRRRLVEEKKKVKKLELEIVKLKYAEDDVGRLERVVADMNIITIEQEKKIEQFEAENAALKKELGDLREMNALKQEVIDGTDIATPLACDPSRKGKDAKKTES